MMRRETDLERALRLQQQARVSEANRQVKLEARPDAHERRVAARARRARRNRVRYANLLAQVGGRC